MRLHPDDPMQSEFKRDWDSKEWAAFALRLVQVRVPPPISLDR